ncbi:transmembrane protein 151 homolog [Adelges cooleyi]|uniref:transmembrane protein 151 homolog n=1 Tax=Adelges cooleyi TaxID=133065 RepID=UPI0021809381|nr:transmembrane protein 151 homolog [Adelges cooleyi]
MPFIPESYEIKNKVPRDRTLRNSFRWKETGRCLALTLLIFTLIICYFILVLTRGPAIELEQVMSLVMTVLLYWPYLMECWACDVIQEILKMEMMSYSMVSDYIYQLKVVEPQIWWEVLSYHYDAQRSPILISRQPKRVEKQKKRRAFDFRSMGCYDLSDSLEFRQRSPIVKIEFTKDFAFARPWLAEEYQNKRNAFYSRYDAKDEYCDKKEGINFIGIHFDKSVYAGQLPRFVNKKMYWLFSALLLSWPYRVYVNYNISYVHVNITKLFGARRLMSSYAPALVVDPAPPAYTVDYPLPFDMFGTSLAMTIYRACPPERVPAELVRYHYDIESGPYALPPAYEDAIRSPSTVQYAVDADRRYGGGNRQARASGRGNNGLPAVTFETSL